MVGLGALVGVALLGFVAGLFSFKVKVRFYAAMHELSVRAWQGHLTAEAMLALLDVVDGPLDGPSGAEPDR
jgi:hypothetical protein